MGKFSILAEGRNESLYEMLDAWDRYTKYLAGSREDLLTGDGATKLDGDMLTGVFFAILYHKGYKSKPRPKNNIFDFPPYEYNIRALLSQERIDRSVRYAKSLLRFHAVPGDFLNGYAGVKELDSLKKWIREGSSEWRETADEVQRKEMLYLFLSCTENDAAELKKQKEFILALPDGEGITPFSVRERVGIIKHPCMRALIKEGTEMPEAMGVYSFLNAEPVFSRLSDESISRLLVLIEASGALSDDTYLIDFSSIAGFLDRDAEQTHIRAMFLNTALEEMLVNPGNHFSCYGQHKMVRVFFDATEVLYYKVAELTEESYHKSTEAIREEIRVFLS